MDSNIGWAGVGQGSHFPASKQASGLGGRGHLPAGQSWPLLPFSASPHPHLLCRPDGPLCGAGFVLLLALAVGG